MADTNRQALEQQMRSVQSRFSRFYAKILDVKNLTVSQFSLLILVVDEGPLTMHDLALKLYLASSSVTNLVDRLEKRKMIARRVHPNDRRAFHIEATTKGKQVVQDIRKLTVEHISSELKGFDAAEMKTIVRFFGAMETILDQQLQQLKQEGQS
ncbi:MAG: hypothetical protein COV74_03820 [Candidatus Omnitrophica bacterium CG11_big_fil_rev_8_21_14_0_20_45_26]|uniref:HTH marR-type domain-containing protein n=1 Tax=Candidatus Abzuiibacterium crystallinum TaxID=1974748 RepID=A0A2H0LQI5_9BACT|nr:MAG: hypothetical protein COV74_03820 [Candidatus Omnitrophica bacterium CG11_big_fil_rev_8_21_14_0_20_45_26]PIW65603.1 MAG: hypothetical protein COW12_00995 [Candidatus Omnitrophica bacterium CG12_big_fil_rev_8_21_14_0_65_45_16]